MTLEAPKNKNYAAVVVALDKFVDLPNCDKVKAALIFGNSVIVAKTAGAGEVGLFFPVETALSTEFCGANNLFRKPEWGNTDTAKKGFFEEHGRVRAVKFRGHKSEGFWIPLDAISYTGTNDLAVGAEFDKIGDHEICHKYIPRNARTQELTRGHQGRQARAEDKIVDGQFRFHIDTENLRRNSHKLDPESWISISEKWHGTSAVFANVLVKRDLTWLERLANYIGLKVRDSDYGLVWSSRRVVKGVGDENKANAVHFYDSDIWGVVAKEIRAQIPKGYTVYAEIVGYTPEGAAIQKGYHYGCQMGAHRTVVYRVTSTNADGRVLELSWQQVKYFCAKYGFEMVKELYHGRAADFFPYVTGGPLADWQEYFVKHLEVLHVSGAMCQHNNNEVPAEGVVLKVDRLEEDEAYKLKSFVFLEWESKQLDKGEADMETAESEAVAE